MFYDSFRKLIPGQSVHFSDGYIAKPIKKEFFFMKHFKEMKAAAKTEGYTFKARFRGPREIIYNFTKKGKQYHRNKSLRQSVCLKDEARFFVIYNVRGV